jgi:hypothetical protein
VFSTAYQRTINSSDDLEGYETLITWSWIDERFVRTVWSDRRGRSAFCVIRRSKDRGVICETTSIPIRLRIGIPLCGPGMMAKLRGVFPLALVIGVLGYIYVEFVLNFTFHWVTNGDLGNGLALPSNFHLVVPAGFVSWGLFFLLGADSSAFIKTIIATVVGSLGALALMIAGPVVADLPDFWGLAIVVGVISFILVIAIPVSDKYSVAACFPTFASVVFWWLATGLDGWAKNGGGVGNSVAALGDPKTAGAGAFGGVLSTPYFMVFVNVLVTLLIGAVFGLVSARLSAMFAPKAPAEEPAGQTAATV